MGKPTVGDGPRLLAGRGASPCGFDPHSIRHFGRSRRVGWQPVSNTGTGALSCQGFDSSAFLHFRAPRATVLSRVGGTCRCASEAREPDRNRTGRGAHVGPGHRRAPLAVNQSPSAVEVRLLRPAPLNARPTDAARRLRTAGELGSTPRRAATSTPRRRNRSGLLSPGARVRIPPRQPLVPDPTRRSEPVEEGQATPRAAQRARVSRQAPAATTSTVSEGVRPRTASGAAGGR